MPVSHIGLTVSHLPTACSFFLSALQPLQYRYVGEQGGQIGLGVRDADFFLCQDTPGVKAGAAHIAFTAPSRAAVRDFYAAALDAGGRPNGVPASRTSDDGLFNAAVLDFDGNSIEVVYRDAPDVRDDGTLVEHSRVLTWRRSTEERWTEDANVVSSRTSVSASRWAVAPAALKTPSVASKAASAISGTARIPRSVSASAAIPQVSTTTSPKSGDTASKAIIGTLLGAAAGAAVAYAMVRSEQDSAAKEADFNAFMEAKAQVPHPIYQTQPLTAGHIRCKNSDAGSGYSTPQHQQESRSIYTQRAIEPAPLGYHTESVHTSVPPRREAPMQIEYAPSLARSHFASHRSVTNPELMTAEKARSMVSRTQSATAQSAMARSAVSSTLISSFVPNRPTTATGDGEGSIASHHTSRSKAKSSHTHASRHTSHSKHSNHRNHEVSPSQPKSLSNAPSKKSSKSVASNSDPFADEFTIDEDNDADTVFPCDSVSNVGAPSRRSHRSKHGSSTSSDVDRHSERSRQDKHSSKHSHHSSSSSSSSRKSQHSSRSKHSEYHSADESPRLPTIISEPSDATTVKPIRSSKSSSSRKDSVTQGEYHNLVDGVRYGTGTVASLPVRGITQSMVDGGSVATLRKDGNKKTTLIRHALGQQMRVFEREGG